MVDSPRYRSVGCRHIRYRYSSLRTKSRTSLIPCHSVIQSLSALLVVSVSQVPRRADSCGQYLEKSSIGSFLRHSTVPTKLDSLSGV